MREHDLEEALRGTGMPVARNAFLEETALPYVVYRPHGSRDLMADDGNHAPVRTWAVELYTDGPSAGGGQAEAERGVEQALRGAGGAWAKDETWIAEEGTTLTSYTTTTIGD
ncbi:MAG: DUF3168 domain-containing protein [Coriobacteriales bacterium]|jgi:hypothetical protein|nr:DUF3168 domain-containing protein [Coriobacteriales bacterium]